MASTPPFLREYPVLPAQLPVSCQHPSSSARTRHTARSTAVTQIYQRPTAHGKHGPSLRLQQTPAAVTVLDVTKKDVSQRKGQKDEEIGERSRSPGSPSKQLFEASYVFYSPGSGQSGLYTLRGLPLTVLKMSFLGYSERLEHQVNERGRKVPSCRSH